MSDGREQTMARWFRWYGWTTERLETWLEELAAQGWHLEKVDRLLMRFHFRRGPERKVRVCVDYQSDVTDEYESLFSDAGWELVVEGAGYYIWRKEYADDKRPEIYTDFDSLIQRNSRLLTVLVLALVIQVPAQLPLWMSGVIDQLLNSSWGKGLTVIYGIVIVMLLWGIVSIARANAKLRERGGAV